MSEEEDVGWVLDGIVNLLRGPVWCVPILTFIEHKSVTFEPKPEEKEEGEEEEEEEDEDEDHKAIHQEYKTLVDFLLQSFMDDLQVTPEQLETACGMAAITTPFQRSLLEQVWAADDYQAFCNMMIQKNIELQLQALEMLQRKYGILPESFLKEEGEGGGEEEDETVKREREVMEVVYRLSLEEHEADTEAMDREMRDLEEAIARSTQDERDRLDRALRRPKKEEEQEEGEEEEEGEGEEEEEAQAEEFSKMPVLPPISSKGGSIDPEDLKRRQEYLKGQRDKLLQMKQKEREKQLQDFEENDNKRPQSATAARKAMDGGSPLDAKTLAVRRALAERLKAEVIKEASE